MTDQKMIYIILLLQLLTLITNIIILVRKLCFLSFIGRVLLIISICLPSIHLYGTYC
jgi:hypothetical protein